VISIEQGIERAEQLLGRKLNRAQTLVLKAVWDGTSYSDLARACTYDAGYLKDTGSKLWQSLSEKLGQKVTKQNVQVLLRQGCTAEANSGRRSIVPCRCDWGEAANVSVFYGRDAELDRLSQWLAPTATPRCVLLAILGLGGAGKTALSVKLAQQMQHEFEVVVWRSLRHAPLLTELLPDLMGAIDPQAEVTLLDNESAQLSRLMQQLQQQRCLIVLDNFESVLAAGAGGYQARYEGYGDLLQRLAEVAHQSTVVITSREKPIEIAYLAGDGLPVRILPLGGLDAEAGLKILAAKGLQGSIEQMHRLVEWYRGNPLALKIAATAIQDTWAGDLTAFFAQESRVLIGVDSLLAQQLDRLSPLEMQVMNWLTVNREPTTIADLQVDLQSAVSLSELVAVLSRLQGRSLVEATQTGFTQQPVIMEYVTAQLVERFYAEICSGQADWLDRVAVIKAETADYIRDAQSRSIVEPLAVKLRQTWGVQTIDRLYDLLSSLRNQQHTGYACGSLLNLWAQTQPDLSGRDFSGLTIRQAYLANVTLHRSSFANATFDRCVFAETFGGVVSVAYSPDGNLLATSHTNGEILIRQLETGKQLVIHKGHEHWVWAIAFSPDSQRLASASDDYQVKLWDVQTGICLKTFVGHTYSVDDIAFSPDGKTIATSSQDATIRLWAMDAPTSSTGTVSDCRILSEHTSRVWAIAFSPDGTILASGSEDHTIKLWELSSDTCVRTFCGHADWVKAITFSPDGTTIASGSFDRTIKLWDAKTGECLHTLHGHSHTITQVRFSPDGNTIASSSYDHTIKLWNRKGRCLRTLSGHSNRVWSIAFSPSGQQLASVGDDHATKLWHLQSGRCTRTFKGYTNTVLSIALSPDAQILASGHEDQTIRLWNYDRDQCIKTLYGHGDRVWSVAFATVDQRVILASGSADRTIRLWDFTSGQCLNVLNGHTSWVWSVAASPDGQSVPAELRGALIASASYDRTVKLWDIRTGKCMTTLTGHTAPVVSVAFSPDGQRLASSSFDATIKLWDVASQQCLRTLEGHENSVWQVAFHPRQPQLISASFDQTLKRWDLHTGNCLQTLKGHSGAIVSVAFDQTGDQLISGGFDHMLKLWDDRHCLQTLRQHEGLVSAVCFHPERSIALSAGFDETIRVWDVTTGANLKTLRAARPYENLNINDTTGLSDAQQVTLQALGALSVKSQVSQRQAVAAFLQSEPALSGRAVSADHLASMMP